MSQPTVGIYFDGWNGVSSDDWHNDLRERLGATLEQVSLAQGRAVRKLASWLQAQILREAGGKTKVPQKVLKRRTHRTDKRGPLFSQSRIWIGINPVPARQLGAVSQAPSGAKAGRRLFRKSFAANVFSDYDQIWVRKGRSRLPIREVEVPIAEGFENVLDKYEAAAARKFEEFFDHELKFAMGWFK